MLTLLELLKSLTTTQAYVKGKRQEGVFAGASSFKTSIRKKRSFNKKKLVAKREISKPKENGLNGKCFHC